MNTIIGNKLDAVSREDAVRYYKSRKADRLKKWAIERIAKDKLINSDLRCRMNKIAAGIERDCQQTMISKDMYITSMFVTTPWKTWSGGITKGYITIYLTINGKRLKEIQEKTGQEFIMNSPKATMSYDATEMWLEPEYEEGFSITDDKLLAANIDRVRVVLVCCRLGDYKLSSDEIATLKMLGKIEVSETTHALC